MKKTLIDIEGMVEVNVSHDEFRNEFYKWLENKEWWFEGVTNDVEESVDEVTEWRGFND